MALYLIDVNLPDRFSLWNSDEYIHVKNLNERWGDTTVWEYAIKHNLTIVTKDRDFYDRILLNNTSPKVIHIRVGNLRIRQFYELMQAVWAEVCQLSSTHKLVLVYQDSLEAIQ